MYDSLRVKLRVPIFILGFLLCSSGAFPDGETPGSRASLSLEESIRIAFKNNKDIQIQEQEILAAKAGILGARSEFLPKVNANAGYSHTGTVLKIAPQPGAKKDPGIFIGFENRNNLGLELNQNLYNGGGNTAGLHQAELKFRIQETSLRSRKLDTEFEAKRLYYGLLLAYESERIARDLLEQAKSHYEEVQQKYNNGTASRFDLLQSKVQVSKLTPELIKATNAVSLIGADFKKLLGFKMQENVSLKDTLHYNPIQVEENEFLKTAYSNNPEVMLLALGVDVGKWSIDKAKAADRPQVNVGLGYDYTSNDVGDMFNSWHDNWNAGISVSVPIFDGYSSKAKVDEAKARYAQAILQKDNFSDQIAVDIKRACLDLQKAQAIIDSQKDSVEESKEALKISEVSYANGEGTNLDVLDSQVSLSQIEKNLSEGVYDYLMAQAFLDRTRGMNWLKEEGNEKKN